VGLLVAAGAINQFFAVGVEVAALAFREDILEFCFSHPVGVKLEMALSAFDPSVHTFS